KKNSEIYIHNTNNKTVTSHNYTHSLHDALPISFHHHEVVGAKMARKRLTALRYPKDVVNDVSRLVELHLRFHGYGTGEWTDTARSEEHTTEHQSREKLVYHLLFEKKKHKQLTIK